MVADPEVNRGETKVTAGTAHHLPATLHRVNVRESGPQLLKMDLLLHGSPNGRARQQAACGAELDIAQPLDSNGQQHKEQDQHRPS